MNDDMPPRESCMLKSSMVATFTNPETQVPTPVRKGAIIDLSDNNGRTALSFAAEKGLLGEVMLLLESNADTDLRDDTGRSPLLWALFHNHTDVAKLLLEKDINVNVKDREGRTALSLCAGRGLTEIAQLLVNKGADLDSKDEDDRPPISYAARWGYTEIVCLLIDGGADPNLVEELQWEEFQTPVCWAVEYGQEAVVRTFLAKTNALQACENTCSDHRKPLMLAFGSQSEAMVKLLLDHGADLWGYLSNDGPLAWAAELGRYNMVQIFLQHETRAYEDRQSHMFSALMLAAESDHGGIVELLLEDGALEGQGAYQTAWDLAECFGQEEVMTTLDPYLTNEDGDGK
ncbi:ankyrin repeat-containing domain protein [Colletotrichum acutatum]|uniref:Ankyrin repeat-containing domain protein n=1 Tax=Glomerella acutata TaxID=27357 RepID=A0AAD8XD69_GLOAC|nr:ankyrin repeat-containing domain protein [Colletotrichum acutatum]KAK1723389.1 ankyrin repeat-containing domain protein [Colletotrichum acutatum]